MQKRTMKNTFSNKGESYIPVCVLVLFLSALVSVLILYIGTMAQVQAQKRDVKTKLDSVISDALSLPNVELIGLHFHIGSQITTMDAYQILCSRINDLQEHVAQLGAKIEIINVGGGLGIDYDNPDNSIPPFEEYFNTFSQLLRLRPGQEVHFELGRSVVGQCGSLISRVIFVKEGVKKRFVMLDAGMTELIRPALYQAHHVIQNLTPHRGVRTYDGGILRLGDGPGLLFEPNLKIVPRQECGRKDIAHLACAIRTEAYATVTGLQTLATRLVDVDHIVVGIVEIIEGDNMKRQKLVVNDTGMVEIEFLKMAADILERRRNKVA